MVKYLSVLGIATTALLSGCSTSTKVVIPDETELYISGDPVVIEEDDTVSTTPYFWTSAGDSPGGGISFELKKGDEVVQRGHFVSEFRPVSIFWPPLAFLYWPMGFHENVTYNLVNDTEIITTKETITVNFLK
jgi:hypothetical protein